MDRHMGAKGLIDVQLHENSEYSRKFPETFHIPGNFPTLCNPSPEEEERRQKKERKEGTRKKGNQEEEKTY